MLYQILKEQDQLLMTGAQKLKTACDNANVYAEGEGEHNNTQANVDAAKKEMRQLYKAISSGKSYRVTDENGVKDGIVHTVFIEEMDN